MLKKLLKKSLALLLILCFALSLSACKGKDEPESTGEESSSLSESNQEDSSGMQADDSESGGETEPTAEPSPTPEPTPEPPKIAAGRFVCFSEGEARYGEDKAPSVVLYDDGSFEFYINLGDVRPLGLAKGTYELNGNMLRGKITEKDSDDFLGHDLQELSFEILGDDYLRYDTSSYGLTLKNNIFTREGSPEYVPPPEATPTPEPTAETLPEESAAEEELISNSILDKGY